MNFSAFFQILQTFRFFEFFLKDIFPFCFYIVTFYLYIYIYFSSSILGNFCDFFVFRDFKICYDYFFFGFVLQLQWLLLNVSEVTTEHQKQAKKNIRRSFFAQRSRRAKKALFLAEALSRSQKKARVAQRSVAGYTFQVVLIHGVCIGRILTAQSDGYIFLCADIRAVQLIPCASWPDPG